MQPKIIEISENPQMPGVRRQVLITQFTVKFSIDPVQQRIELPLIQELHIREQSEVPVLDGQGHETGETETIYGPWKPFMGLGVNQIACYTESTNQKFVDPVTKRRVPPGTEGAVPELAAIWDSFGGPITQLLVDSVLQIDANGGFNDLTKL